MMSFVRCQLFARCSAAVIGRAPSVYPGRGWGARALSTRTTERGAGFEFDERYLRGAGGAVFPLVWLRYNCPCPHCLHPASQGRQVLGRDLQLAPRVRQLLVDRPGSLGVVWGDGHESHFGLDWLSGRSFDETSVARRRAGERASRVPWGRTFRPAVLDFARSLRTDEGLRVLLAGLRAFGLVVLENARGDKQPLREVEARFGFVTPSAYGRFFEVRSKPASSNLAYTASTLGLHTDLPYLQEPPGIQLLHCVRQTSDVRGGENQFADAVYAARRLRRADPAAFRALKEESVTFWDYGSDVVPEFHLRATRPVLSVDDDDDVALIAYNHQVLDSHMSIPAPRVHEWFRAVARLEATLNEEAVHWRLEPGQIAVFDNTRVLHGRSGYSMAGSDAERHLRGAYLSWDLVNSLHRRLTEEPAPGTERSEP